MARWWLQTRGRTADYRFLGEEPEPERWWAPYLRFSAPEDPMLIVETTATGWRAYCTAMQTGRRDWMSPPRDIRLSLLVEGTRGESPLLGQVLAGWFSGTLERQLRGALPAETVEAWLLGHPSATVSAEVARVLAAGVVDETASPIARRMACGPATDATVQAKFVVSARAAARGGARGVFCWLNLLSNAEEIFGIDSVRRAASIVVLVDERTDVELAPHDVEVPPNPNPRVAGDQGKPRSTGLPNAACLLILLVAGAMVLLVVLLASGRG